MTRKIFPLKLTPQERALLDAHATAAKMTAAEWLRRCIAEGVSTSGLVKKSAMSGKEMLDLYQSKYSQDNERPDDFGPE